ncbi:Uncharacterised protein [Aeromonas salmonicida]|uniref:hypothetical protein n=1 Tax=Aeromonas salmonicida TaxID=645 RepID=UPI0010275A93|nr:hypothetical protein [Aeromonas salmonicida]VFB11146.1 Uncharacterised protein [Aeromonas salmonicida]
MQASEWHALNGLALYRTQQLKEAIAELKTPFASSNPHETNRLPAWTQPASLMTLGNLYAT